jgi:hypothetical protein
MSQKLQLKFNQSNFSDFLKKLGDLASIDDTVKLKIDESEILMYSIISNEVTVLALQNYILKTQDYINFNKPETFDFIITNANKFVKNLKFFDITKPIKFEIVSKTLPDDDTVQHVRSAQLTNDKLKISWIGGEQYKIKDITKSNLNARLNPKNARWSFNISNTDFTSVKKLSTINNEDKTINITVDGGRVTINETSKWELEVDQIKPINQNIIFGKKYLSNIDDQQDTIKFDIFDNFILIKGDDSNLMLSFEQDFSTDED